MPQAQQVQVWPDALCQGELLRVLQGLVPFKFAPESRRAGTAGVIQASNTIPTRVSQAVPCLRFAKDGSSAGEQQVEVRFSDDVEVPFPFKGRTIQTSIPRLAAEELGIPSGQRVLATANGQPVWTVSQASGSLEFGCALPFPALAAGENVRDVLNGERFLQTLVLLQFLRRLGHKSLFQPPSLRACFMFDDPNLHWPRYGFVDYRAIAEHAAKHSYHVAFATIPLDAWFTHEPTARVFREHPGQLSLLVHGNDHLRAELARDYTDAERLALLRQALHRVEKLEQRSGVPVSRVMVPPHGACSTATLAVLPSVGFEAACISHGSLRAFNRDQPWVKSLGFLPSELVHGCPVLPRWGLGGAVRNTVLLAAYLDQPLILRGHQADLRHGLELLDSLADFINSLGPIQWGSVAELSRQNYLCAMEGTTFRVKPQSRKLNLDLPEGTRRLAIEHPTRFGSGTWSLVPAGMAQRAAAGVEFEISSGDEGRVLVEFSPEAVAGSENGVSRPWFVPLARRMLTEGRDRLFSTFGA